MHYFIAVRCEKKAGVIMTGVSSLTDNHQGSKENAAIIVSEASLKRSQKILLENKVHDVPVLTREILDRM